MVRCSLFNSELPWVMVIDSDDASDADIYLLFISWAHSVMFGENKWVSAEDTSATMNVLPSSLGFDRLPFPSNFHNIASNGLLAAVFPIAFVLKLNAPLRRKLCVCFTELPLIFSSYNIVFCCCCWSYSAAISRFFIFTAYLRFSYPFDRVIDAVNVYCWCVTIKAKTYKEQYMPLKRPPYYHHHDGKVEVNRSPVAICFSQAQHINGWNPASATPMENFSPHLMRYQALYLELNEL